MMWRKFSIHKSHIVNCKTLSIDEVTMLQSEWMCIGVKYNLFENVSNTFEKVQKFHQQYLNNSKAKNHC